MTVTRGCALFLTIAVAGTLLQASAPGGGSAAPAVRLKAISARVSAKGASLVIEASEPVAYLATRPDPLTVLLDFRNVGADGITNAVAADDKSPIARVTVEPADSLGAPASRVRVVLTQPVAHRVRSDRNTVVIDFDKPTAKAAPYVMPPTALQTGAPNAMMALQAPSGAADPLAVLGLSSAFDGLTAAPAQATGSATIPLPSQAATAQPPQPGQSVGAARTARQFTGNPISLDFQGADLRAVLRTFSEISGLNMVIDPKVTGTVDVALRDVPWDQALDIILRANGLDWRVDGTIVRIAPIEIFTAEDKSRSDAADAQSAAEHLTTMTRQLSYAKGEDIRKLLEETRTITKYGQARVDLRTNTLIVTDLPGQLAQVQSLVNTLDTPQPQVEIEARIINTNKDYARALGVQWGFQGRVDPALGNTTALAFPNNGSLGGRTGGAQGATATGGAQPTAANFPVSAATSAIGLALGSVNGAFNLDVALSALESSGNGRILSTPRITTQNNIEAVITQGVKLPVPSPAGGLVPATTTYVDAALSLKVTPQISAAGTVIMTIEVNNNQVGVTTADGIAIDTQSAKTTLLVGDGQTTVIGGIYSSTNTTTNNRTPGLGSVPLLKWLFKRDSVSDQNRELLIFITPRIIKQ